MPSGTPIDYATHYDEDEHGCWIWRGARRDTGYGVVLGGSAHRWFYEHHVGPIPDGMQIDHRCRVRACVNPAHLEAVTSQTNNLRRPNAIALRGACAHGHPVCDANGYFYDRTRPSGATTREYMCRACTRERMRARRSA